MMNSSDPALIAGENGDQGMKPNQGTPIKPPSPLDRTDRTDRQRFLEEQTSELLWQIDAQGRLLDLSPSWHRLTGHPPAPLLGQPLAALLHPEDLAPFQQALTQAFQTPDSHPFPPHRLLHADGFWRWFSATATLIGPEADGEPATLIGLARDITARVQMEEALKQNQALLSATQQLSGVGGWEWDLAAQSMYWTDETYRIHGLSRGDIDPDSADHIRLSLDRYRPEDRSTVLTAFRRCVEQGQPYDLQLPFTTVDGRRLWVRTKALPVEEGTLVVKVIGNLIDITHHKQVEMILRARLHLSESAPALSLEALLQKMLDQAEALTNSSGGFFHIPETPQTAALQVWSTRTRHCSSTNGATDWNDLDDTSAIREECIRRHGPVIDNCDGRSPHQGDRSAESSPLLHRRLAVPIIRNREVVAVFGVGTTERDYDQRDIDLVRSLGDMTWDIVLRKRAEIALIESEERFRQLFDTIPAVAVQGYGMDGITRYWNQASERLYGYRASEALGRNLLELIIPAPMRPEVARAMAQMAASGQPLAAAELSLMRRDGSLVPVFSSHAVINLPGRPLELFCVDIDLSAHKQIEAALRASEYNYREIYNSTSEAIMIDDARTGAIIDVNDATLRMYGYAGKEEILAGGVGRLSAGRSPYGEAEARELIRKCTEEGPQIFEWLAKKRSGETFWVEVSLRKTEIGGSGKILAVIRSINKRKLAEMRILEQADFTRRILDSTDAHIAIINEQGIIVDVNSAWLRYAEENSNAPHAHLGPGASYFCSWATADGDATAAEAVAGIRRVQQGEIESFQLTYPCHSPTTDRWFSLRAQPLQGSSGHVLVSHTDITPLKQSEHHLAAALAEKEVLLREVHHRVKNNLAAIIGLLDLQGRLLDSSTQAGFLAELSNRIRSMSLVHEHLYRAESLASINFEQYLQALVAHLQTSLGVPRISCQIEAAAIELPLDLAVPCGMIINELITNAFKYAFPGEGTTAAMTAAARILISLRHDRQTFTLAVADNGVGLPPGFDLNTVTTLGLSLVRMLGQHQLGGRYQVDFRDGTRFTLTFSLDHRRTIDG